MATFSNTPTSQFDEDNSKANEKNNDNHKWIFIQESFISTSPEEPIQHIIPEPNPYIKVPFPPEINPFELIRTDEKGELRSRCTNKFLIYRNEYAKQLETYGYKISMRKVSCMAARAWKEEPNHVIRYYEDIAREVEKLHVQLSMNSVPSETTFNSPSDSGSESPTISVHSDNFFSSTITDSSEISHPSQFEGINHDSMSINSFENEIPGINNSIQHNVLTTSDSCHLLQNEFVQNSFHSNLPFPIHCLNFPQEIMEREFEQFEQFSHNYFDESIIYNNREMVGLQWNVEFF
ncbi:11016_t:CDS:1 [Ambispora gerdemannii]|uniref:11016_t:CDS:1 n=1 Tax=Ambispora gerdemannii TaxID=144530 RepID=A0A9N9FGX5_9GLOM|nr:11016_t:CDS:1 [Ambispora gerdemannii]